LKGQICHLFGDREIVGEIPRGKEITKILGKLEKLVENRSEFRGQDFRTIAGIPSGPLDLEVLS